MHPKSERTVAVVEDYRAGYVPASHVAANVAELLQYVPPRHLRFLDSVVVTNASGLDREYAASPTTWGVRLGHCLGMYYRAVAAKSSRRTTPAYIVLFVDNILNRHVN